jgi:hypothetical protein
MRNNGGVPRSATATSSELAAIPSISQRLLVEKWDLCHDVMLDFFSNDPVQTFAPIRRSGAIAGTSRK